MNGWQETQHGYPATKPVEYDYRTADRLKQQDDRIEALEARVKVLERILASQLLVPMDILK